jgi:hypothetical protein
MEDDLNLLNYTIFKVGIDTLTAQLPCLPSCPQMTCQVFRAEPPLSHQMSPGDLPCVSECVCVCLLPSPVWPNMSQVTCLTSNWEGGGGRFYVIIGTVLLQLFRYILLFIICILVGNILIRWGNICTWRR